MVYLYKKWFSATASVKNVIVHKFRLGRRIGIGFLFTGFSILAGVSYGFLTVKNFDTTAMVKNFIAHTSIASVSGLMLALVLFGIIWHFLIPHHKRVVIKQSDLE